MAIPENAKVTRVGKTSVMKTAHFGMGCEAEFSKADSHAKQRPSPCPVSSSQMPGFSSQRPRQSAPSGVYLTR